RDDVAPDQNFFDLGGHSLLLLQLHARLRRELAPDLHLMDLFRFPTVRSLAQHIGRAVAAPEATPMTSPGPIPTTETAIAIVGMAGRFPRAPDLASFWRRLRAGEECIQFFSE